MTGLSHADLERVRVHTRYLRRIGRGSLADAIDVLADNYIALDECPGCGLMMARDDLRAQAKHMEEKHPDIIQQRRTEAARFAGWEDED